MSPLQCNNVSSSSEISASTPRSGPITTTNHQSNDTIIYLGFRLPWDAVPDPPQLANWRQRVTQILQPTVTRIAREQADPDFWTS